MKVVYSLVTKQIEEWVLNAPIKRSQSMLGSFGWTKDNDDDSTLKMAVLSNEAIHTCLAVSSRTQASTRFVTDELFMF